MKSSFPLLILAVAIAGAPAHAQVKLGQTTAAVFATVPEAREILTSRDDFVQRMSPFDRAARMKTDGEVSEAGFLRFVGENLLAWNEAEKQKISSAIEGIQVELQALALPFPQQVWLIKTTGNEEGGAAYTRSNAIVFPEADLTRAPANLQKTIAHELFHILSRANPELREALYGAIGFVQCNEIEFPPGLQSRKLTNPDAPRNDHYIRLQVGGEERWAVPILVSRAEKYEVRRGGEFFNYLQLQFLVVERKEDAIKAVYEGNQPKFLGAQPPANFFEQVGRNTGYIIHPEEILADNFALLVMHQRNLPSSGVIQKIEVVLKANRVSGP